MGARRLAIGLAVVCVLAGCSGDDTPGESDDAEPSASSSSSTSAGEVTGGDLSVTHPTLWLCSPDQDDDACDAPLTTTDIRADGSRAERTIDTGAAAPIDCFYVYPTVSDSQDDYAPLEVTPVLESTALAQAAAFSSVCRVYAPVYRQRTVASLFKGLANSGPGAETAYDDVRSAFADYLAQNPDRRFVLMGHSQGSFVLTRLIQDLLDGDSDQAEALRARMVSALVIGAAVKTEPGEPAGGDFQDVPICEAAGDTGCVVAYNTYSSRPGANAIFGRPDPNRGLDAVCTNPLDLLGADGDLHPMFPSDRLNELGELSGSPPDTTFVSLPDYVTAECQARDGFAWLQASVEDDPADVRPDALPERLGPDWGLHVVDVSIALGDLVELVRRQSGP